jgi:hypothetical protein
MSTRNKTLVTAGALLAAAALASAQTVADPRGAFNVTLPQDGPLALVSADWGPSGATARGGAVVVDLHSTLVLRNTGGRRIRGVSLLVLAQEVTPGGKASVTTPSLNVGPGESFPVRVDLRLMRPPAAPSSALVEVGLDGVLFDDLSFYGPNRLNSRRTMLAWEMEARRDRRALVAALDSGGPEALRKILVAAFARDAALPRLDMQLARGRATNAEPEHQAELACLRLPDAPVDLAGASAWVSSAEARAPRITVRSLARRPIRYLEVGWLVRDAQGREVLAGTLPADLNLAPGQESVVQKDNTLRFSRPVAALSTYVAAVEYADGELWIPTRAALADPRLAAALPPSGEEMRLADLYRRKGLDAVVAALGAMR